MVSDAVLRARRATEVCIQHPHWLQAALDLEVALLSAQPGEVILVTGPSRVGKSRLVDTVLPRVIRGMGLDGEMPFVTIPLHNNGPNASFSTKTFVWDQLRAIGHPIYGRAHCSGDSQADIARAERLSRIPGYMLDDAFDNGLVARGTKYLVYKEVQHALHMQGGEKVQKALLDSWKINAEKNDYVLIFDGAYPALDLLTLSPHLIGRKHIVHFPRYKLQEGDVRRFNSVLDALSRFVPLPKGVTSLSKWNELIWRHTRGCVGLVIKLVVEASVHAELEGRSVTKELLKSKCHSNKDLQQIENEIETGEAWFEDGKAESSGEDAMTPTESEKKRSGKPFQRNAKRHLSGGRI